MAARVVRDGPQETLGETNWPSWSDQMRAFLFIKGCADWIETELPDDAAPEDILNAKTAMNWIKLCVSLRWARRIKGMDSPSV